MPKAKMGGWTQDAFSPDGAGDRAIGLDASAITHTHTQTHTHSLTQTLTHSLTHSHLTTQPPTPTYLMPVAKQQPSHRAMQRRCRLCDGSVSYRCANSQA